MKIKKILTLLIILEKCLFGVIVGNEQNLDTTNPKSGSVIFVHGFMRTSKNMSALTFSFKKDGWNIENWSYPSSQKYIEDHAEELINRIKLLSERYPGRPISFVTHSMGGLIVRCALNHPNCPDEAKMGRAVLIAPPNRGSIFARKLYKYRAVRGILGQKSGKQLMTTRQDGFDRFGDFPNHMPVLVISGTAGFNPMITDKNDGKVACGETCLKTAHYHESNFSGHSWICYTPGVIKRAKEFLSSSVITGDLCSGRSGTSFSP